MPSKILLLLIGLALVTIGFLLGRSRTLSALIRRLFHPTRLSTEELDALLDAELYDRAAALCEKHLKEVPADTDARFRYGMVLISLNRFDEALAQFSQIFFENPDCTGAIHQAAYCLLRIDQSHTALTYIDHLITREPANSDFALCRAEVLSSLGRREEAREIFSRIRPAVNDIDGRIARSWCLASVYTDSGEPEKAAAEYENALELGCEDPECRLLLSVTRQQAGDRKGALDAVMKQLLLTPDFIPAYIQAGRILTEEKEYAQALSYYDRIADRVEEPLHYERAVCLAALGRNDEALSSLRSLLRSQSSVCKKLLRDNAERDFPSLLESSAFRTMLEE